MRGLCSSKIYKKEVEDEKAIQEARDQRGKTRDRGCSPYCMSEFGYFYYKLTGKQGLQQMPYHLQSKLISVSKLN